MAVGFTGEEWRKLYGVYLGHVLMVLTPGVQDVWTALMSSVRLWIHSDFWIILSKEYLSRSPIY